MKGRAPANLMNNAKRRLAMKFSSESYTHCSALVADCCLPMRSFAHQAVACLASPVVLDALITIASRRATSQVCSTHRRTKRTRSGGEGQEPQRDVQRMAT